MKEQNFKNHGRLVPLFHYVLGGIVIAALVGSVIKAYRSYQTGQTGMLVPALLILICISLFITAMFARSFALKAQDRAIRAEERLRYFVLTGKLPDSRITMNQYIALRFAPDNELVDLAQRAVNEQLSQRAIKSAIRNWRADYDRV